MERYFYLIKTSVLFAMLVFGVMACPSPSTPELKITGAKIGGTSISGSTAAVGIPITSTTLTIEFSEDVDAATVKDPNITLKAGATNVTLMFVVSAKTVTATITGGALARGINYTVAITKDVKGKSGALLASASSYGFTTEGKDLIGGAPQAAQQVLYLPFDNETKDKAGTHTVSQIGTVHFQADRNGTDKSAVHFPGDGSIVEVAYAADLYNASTTFSFWMKALDADFGTAASDKPAQIRRVMGMAGERGFFFEFGRRSNDATNVEGYNEYFLKLATNHKNNGANATAESDGTSWAEVNKDVKNGDGTANGQWKDVSTKLTDATTGKTFIKGKLDKWIHVVMRINAASKEKTIFIDGEKMGTVSWPSSDKEWQLADFRLKTATATTGAGLALGWGGLSTYTETGWLNYQTEKEKTTSNKQFFKGWLDDIRIYKVALSDAEVNALYDLEKP